MVNEKPLLNVAHDFGQLLQENNRSHGQRYRQLLLGEWTRVLLAVEKFCEEVVEELAELKETNSGHSEPQHLSKM